MRHPHCNEEDEIEEPGDKTRVCNACAYDNHSLAEEGLPAIRRTNFALLFTQAAITLRPSNATAAIKSQKNSSSIFVLVHELGSAGSCLCATFGSSGVSVNVALVTTMHIGNKSSITAM